jgi:hypothetical protein
MPLDAPDDGDFAVQPGQSVISIGPYGIVVTKCIRAVY